MMRARIDENNWIRCGRCGHKLGRASGDGVNHPAPVVEIKCHSCKEINNWYGDMWKGEKENG